MKKITLDLSRIADNAFAFVAEFTKQAYREDWTEKEIKEVIAEAKKGDYDHLLQTFIKYCK